MRILITGGCGFLGSNLAIHGIDSGYEIIVVDNFYRNGSQNNLEWLRSRGEFKFFEVDIADYEKLNKVFVDTKPDVVFHLAGQTAMTTSLNFPLEDFRINTIGSLNILECMRNVGNNCRAIYASSNKIYGDLNYIDIVEQDSRYSAPDYLNGFPETMKIDFSTPYGCSKGSADLYFLDYYKSYQSNVAVFRHSTMYGGRQYATVDQGWIGYFCEELIKPLDKAIDIYGVGKQVRDILHCDDIVELYYSSIDNFDKIKGEAFNIGGGPENSLSLLELFNILEIKTGNSMKYNINPMRVSDQKVYISDISKIKDAIKWTPKVNIDSGIDMMLDWVKNK
ncbi:GDP-mannose 4,6-dehydratase [bacterium]|nr:GDP-mannose 4,6-dehydratase [bacterium]|tara:strand:- start:137 stop:1144 length:1008 start_codon:yes stop_codon:yes gene_type:complete